MIGPCKVFALSSPLAEIEAEGIPSTSGVKIAAEVSVDSILEACIKKLDRIPLVHELPQQGLQASGIESWIVGWVELYENLALAIDTTNQLQQRGAEGSLNEGGIGVLYL